MPKDLAKWLKSALDIVYPDLCCICGADLVHPEVHLCTSCLFDLPYITTTGPDVTKLQKLFTGRVEIQVVHSLLNYQKGNQVQDLLHIIKYKSRPGLATHLGRVLAQAMPKDHTLTHIVPLPLHPKKERKRGFNQSKAIASGIAEVLGLPVSTDIIRRRVYNESQTGFSKYDRYNNVRSIFEVIKPPSAEKPHFLLIDDVLTTGATIESCASELLSIPHAMVSVATLAARV